MSKGLVSVITPCYNTGHILSRLFDSLLSQTYPDIEVIDRFYEPYDLGDDREALLRKALTKAGYTNFTPIEDNKGTSRAAIRNIGVPFKSVSRNPLDGKRILLQRPHKTYDLKQPQ